MIQAKPHLYLVVFFTLGAGAALLHETGFASEPEDLNASTAETRRFAGWLSVDRNKIGVMLFVEPSGDYGIIFSSPALRANVITNQEDSAMEAWLLTSNGTEVPRIWKA